MRQRLSPITALACGFAALVVSLGFGSEAFVREVLVERRGGGNATVLAQALTAPNYSRYVAAQGGDTFDRYAFLVVFTLGVAVLVLATARGATGFVAGWTATVAAGAVAGFVRGLTVADAYGGYGPYGGGSTLAAAFQFAGSGAVYGLLIGWGVGVVAVLGVLISGRTGPRAPLVHPGPGDPDAYGRVAAPGAPPPPMPPPVPSPAAGGDDRWSPPGPDAPTVVTPGPDGTPPPPPPSSDPGAWGEAPSADRPPDT